MVAEGVDLRVKGPLSGLENLQCGQCHLYSSTDSYSIESYLMEGSNVLETRHVSSLAFQ